jgi:serine/threonine-protein kinase
VAATDALRGASWASDGTIVYGTLDGGLARVAAGGGQPQRLTEPDRSKSEGSHRWPTFLPGQRHVLFTVQHASLRNERGAIAVLSLQTGRWTTVFDGGVYGRYLPSGHLVFERNGTVLAVPFDVKTLKAAGSPVPVLNDVWYWSTSGNAGFDVSAGGTLVYANETSEPPGNALVWVGREGQVEPIAPDRRAYQTNTAVLSPDGRRVAVTISGGRYDTIWVYDLRDRRWQELGVEADCYSPIWSPSGDRLAFNSNREGMLNLFVMTANGEGRPVRLAASSRVQIPYSWSRDGLFLAYLEQGNVMETYILPLDGGAKPWRWLPEGVMVTSPAFSPDGRWLAYQSLESGTWEVWVRPFPGPGAKHRVSGSDGGFAPAWSSDGGEIFYLERLGATRIMSRRVESTSPWRLAEPHVAFALSFALADAGAFQPRAYAVEPGGRRVFVVQPDERAPKDITVLHVVTNWAEEVKAKLGGGK